MFYSLLGGSCLIVSSNFSFDLSLLATEFSIYNSLTIASPFVLLLLSGNFHFNFENVRSAPDSEQHIGYNLCAIFVIVENVLPGLYSKSFNEFQIGFRIKKLVILIETNENCDIKIVKKKVKLYPYNFIKKHAFLTNFS